MEYLVQSRFGGDYLYGVAGFVITYSIGMLIQSEIRRQRAPSAYWTFPLGACDPKCWINMLVNDKVG